MKRPGLAAAMVGLGTVIGVSMLTPFWKNAVSMVFDRGYWIPAESSVFSLQVLEWNGGSGDYWLLAEDRRYYYGRVDSDGVRYLAFPKSKIRDCAGFNLNALTSWCPDLVIVHRQRG